MNDWGKSVLDQYDLSFDSVRRGKGVLLCTAGKQEYSLAPFRGSEKRLSEEAGLLNYLTECGHLVDTMIATREGDYIARNEYQDPFMLRIWHPGEECTSANPEHLTRAAAKLARLHLDMSHVPALAEKAAAPEGQPEPEKSAEDTRLITSLQEDFERHNRELKKIIVYVKKRKQKTEFEAVVTDSFSAHMEQALRAVQGLRESAYQQLLADAVQKRSFVHGSYNYHYVYLLRQEEAVVNFSKFAIQVQILDLYDFLRKCMEKNEWNPVLGQRLIDTYERIRPISREELQILKMALLYPEKYWKQLNAYYNSSKAWIPLRSLEKLKQAVVQSRMREQFVEAIFDGK